MDGARAEGLDDDDDQPVLVAAALRLRLLAEARHHFAPSDSRYFASAAGDTVRVCCHLPMTPVRALPQMNLAVAQRDTFAEGIATLGLTDPDDHALRCKRTRAPPTARTPQRVSALINHLANGCVDLVPHLIDMRWSTYRADHDAIAVHFVDTRARLSRILRLLRRR